MGIMRSIEIIRRKHFFKIFQCPGNELFTPIVEMDHSVIAIRAAEDYFVWCDKFDTLFSSQCYGGLASPGPLLLHFAKGLPVGFSERNVDFYLNIFQQRLLALYFELV